MGILGKVNWFNKDSAKEDVNYHITGITNPHS